MSITQIQISTGPRSLLASPDSAGLSVGDQIAFVSTGGAGDAEICFSDNAKNFLTPAPAGPLVLAAGSTLTFTVTGTPQGCAVAVRAKGGSGTPDYDNIPPGMLAVLTPFGRPGPVDPTQQ
jgi:hypothetical protein